MRRSFVRVLAALALITSEASLGGLSHGLGLVPRSPRSGLSVRRRRVHAPADTGCAVGIDTPVWGVWYRSAWLGTGPARGWRARGEGAVGEAPLLAPPGRGDERCQLAHVARSAAAAAAVKFSPQRV